MVTATFALGEVLISMIWFFLFFVWIMLLFRVFADLFRSSDLSGFAKVVWILFVVFMPYLGVFVYIIARGGKMAANEVAVMQANDAATREYIRSAAGSTSTADELARLADLRDRGVIDEAEFAALKAKALA